MLCITGGGWRGVITGVVVCIGWVMCRVVVLLCVGRWETTMRCRGSSPERRGGAFLRLFSRAVGVSPRVRSPDCPNGRKGGKQLF